MPLVSVIIANWNGAHHLRICLPSLLAQTHRPLEIIVADNGSSDDSATVVQEHHATWLPLKENVGLAPALNCGARAAAGEFLLFVNNDMRFDPHFVESLLEPLLDDERVFASDGMQYDWNGTKAEHLAARLVKSRPASVSYVEMVPWLFFYQQSSSRPIPVFMGSAACMLIRKSIFVKLGGFDSRLPLGYEDVEICWRASILGWKTIFVPTAVCWHHVGASGRSIEGALFNFRGVLTGRLLLATKLLPFRYVVSTWIVSVLGLSKDLGRFRWRFAKDRIGVLLHLALLSPRLFRERFTLFRNAGITPEEQLGRFLRLKEEGANSDLRL
jgi:GT2 family glycosyltransferase